MSLLATTTGAKTSSSSIWSYQLQFNFKFNKSSFLLLHNRLPTLNDRCYRCRRRCRLSVRCVVQDEAQSEKGPSGNNSNSSWVGLGNADVDWFDQSGDSQHKQGIGGILGVGLASVLLVAGITSAALSFGKRSSSRPRQEMEPLTQQEEILVTLEEEALGKESLTNLEHSDQEVSILQNAHNLESKADSQDTAAGGITGEDLDVVGVDVSTVESLSTNEQEGPLEASQTDTRHNSIESSSTAFHDDTEASAPKYDATLDTEHGTSGDAAIAASVLATEDVELPKAHQPSGYGNSTFLGDSSSTETAASEAVSFVAESSVGNLDAGADVVGERPVVESQSPKSTFTSRGIPAPSLLSAALQVPPGKVLVPAVADQTQAQALSALQVLKVIESDAQAGDLCTRREYARWLVSASSVLSRNLILKVYPAMYIENVTELAFDDITPEDPDFMSIQGLGEAGLISSKLSRRDMLSSPDEDIGSFYFHPNSPLSRQDLVTWKMALEKRQLPEADSKALHKLSGFIDIDRIDPDAVPALVADISAGDQGITALAFGYTRLFQPDKPVTKGQAAIALATGEAADIVSEELARIEAESMADKAVAAHNALVAEVEKDINANFEKELLMEREKNDLVQKMAEEATTEVERLRAEREEQNSALMKERAAVESEMEVLSKLRHELEEQLQGLMSNKVEISYEKERIEKLRKETEEENQAITRLQYELEVERKALSMARAWAEDEARRVQEHAKALEEARDRWERQGIKVVVDEDLQDNAVADVTWSNVGKKLALEETVERAETLTDKLKLMASGVQGKSKQIINQIIEKIQLLISAIKEWIFNVSMRTTKLKDVTLVKTGESVQALQQHLADLGLTVKEGAKRVVDDCRGGVDKLTQRFKA